MGRLVFDNLKKVTLYLMPVSRICGSSVFDPHSVAGRKLFRIHGGPCKRITRHADSHELVSTSVLLHHK